jgi:hypothetical protein
MVYLAFGTTGNVRWNNFCYCIFSWSTCAMRNPTTFFLFLFFVLLNVADFVTAMFVKSGEANPVFLLFGNIWALLVIKIIVLSVLGYYILCNNYDTNFSYFLMLSVIILGISTIAVAVFGNVYALLHPQVLAASSSLSTAEKTSGYASFMLLIYIIPFGLNILVFKVYEWTIKWAVIKK